MNTQLMTPPQVAEHLQVSVDTRANWRYLQKGPAYVRQGRIVRYHADALTAWISTHEVSASA